ncbi:hypothetical protein HX001_14585 [Empedobacter brevis]|uniref:Uncharacterized protein n=1 Tax=Empedobacter brevis TaxID=247 RepID=A0AAJ1QGP1_9FLAO|nr:hypothetical protein [Empedobacter brevis]MDM1073713.1 hypothetical protein [Empedobacter brevis]QHC85013.1 hypothetical protein AS589_09615 [Empedobacter brevis]
MTDQKLDTNQERDDIFDTKVLMTDQTKNKDLKHEGNKKSFLFKSMIFIMVFLILSILYRGYQLLVTNDYLFRQMLNEDAPKMPEWYPIVTIVLGIIALAGIFLVNAYKRIGVYMVVVSLFASAVIQPEFMADGTLFTMFSLFVFIGYGLAIIYPYWYKFK